MSAPRALLLDFGSVLSVSFFERLREVERALGLPSSSLKWLGPIAPETDALWQSMQQDEITERHYWKMRARELGEAVGEPNWDMRTLLQRTRQTDPGEVIRPQFRLIIAAARARGIRVGILSNELELFYGPELLHSMRLPEQFDAVVDASITQILKPDPRAYALAVDSLGVPAAETLFVDDQFRNIAGAIRAGLQTQYFDLRDVAGNLAALVARLQLSVRLSA
jgi:putative hydrolase of the HAD superfamily